MQLQLSFLYPKSFSTSQDWKGGIDYMKQYWEVLQEKYAQSQQQAADGQHHKQQHQLR